MGVWVCEVRCGFGFFDGGWGIGSEGWWGFGGWMSGLRFAAAEVVWWVECM